MSEPHVQWTAPSPLWESLANATDPAVRQTLGQPAILRFASDTFMDELLAMLDSDLAQVRDLVAQPETWRGPTPPAPAALQAPAPPMSRLARRLQRVRRIAERTSSGRAAPPPTTEVAADGAQLPLKLYQPAHQRYYLIASCLVCRQIGLPDRTLDTANQERATFVVRRLVHPDPANTTIPGDPTSWAEYALVQTPRGSVWQQITDATQRQADVLVPGEEQLPLFAMHFTAADGRKRRLFAGLIPVGRREAYLGAARGAPGQAQGTQLATVGDTPATVAPTDPRMVLLYIQVTEPWKRLLERAEAVRKLHAGEGDPTPAAVQQALLKTAREQIQTVSWYIVLDLVRYLAQYLPAVWQVVMGQQPPSTLAGTPADTLFTALENTTISESLIKTLTDGNPLYTRDSVWPSLRQALQGIEAYGAALEGVTRSYDREVAPAQGPQAGPVWPTRLFPLAEPLESAPLPPLTPPPTGTDLEMAQQRVDHLAELVRLALPLETTAPMPAPALAAQELLDVREGWFVLRCVFERPNCGSLEPPIVSAPTPPFQLAGFFDPDAPARPIRIALPTDTSPAGLRKFDKNTVFMVSDILCGQIDRVKALNLGDLVRSVLPWPFHKELSAPDTGPCTDPNNPSLSLGMLCSLSIPIITLCAVFLLMIIVNLLDIIFRWLPYFLICFPVPGLKGKKS
jgi:hypothetical protein